MRKVGVVFVLIFITFLVSCSGAGGTNTGVGVSHALIIENSDQLIGGPVAEGEEGDILIYNNLSRFIIKVSDYPYPVPLRGMVVDGDIRRFPGERGEDIIPGVIFYYLPGHFVRPAQIVESLPEISIQDDGNFSGVAAVKVTGKDRFYPDSVTVYPESISSAIKRDLPLEFTVDYFLPPDSPCLRVLVTVKNKAENDITIYPGILLPPGPGKSFAGNYGFTGYRVPQIIDGISYIAKEFQGITFGVYSGGMEKEPLSPAFALTENSGYSLLTKKSPSDVVPAGERRAYSFAVCVVKGYTGELYSFLTKMEGVDRTTVSGYTCYTSGNDKVVQSGGTSRKVCVTEEESEENGKTSNSPIDGVDIFLLNNSGEVLAHTRSGNDSEVYYQALETLDKTRLYRKSEWKGKYKFTLPGNRYRIWAVRNGFELADTNYLNIFPPPGTPADEGIIVEHADFVFPWPVTLDVFAKLVPASPTSARLILKGENLYPVTITKYLDRFGYSYRISGENLRVFYIGPDGYLPVELSPGKYTYFADKGIFYNTVTGSVNIISGSKTLLLKFKRVVDSLNYVATDPFIENLSWGNEFDEESRTESVISSSIDGGVIFDYNISPVTFSTELPVLYGDFLYTPYGNFFAFPLFEGELSPDFMSNPESLFKHRSYTVLYDLSDSSSYFVREGVHIDFNTGKIKPDDFKNDFDMMQILPVKDLKKVILEWFRLLQVSPDGKDENFIFHPLIGGSMSSSPLFSPPGLVETYIYSGPTTSATLVNQEECRKFKELDEDINDSLCMMWKGNSVVGRFVFFSFYVTTSAGKRGFPGEYVAASSGDRIYLNLTIESPAWAKFDKIYIFDGLQDYGYSVTDPFSKAVTVAVSPQIVQVGYENSMKRYEWSGVIEYPFALNSNADSWVVIAVVGDNPASYYPSLKPFAISNPVFIDTDLQRGYNPPCPGMACPSR